MQNNKTKTAVMTGMICAMAFVLVLILNIPIMPTASFLKYEPKDIIITIGGFIFGPLVAVVSSIIVSLIEFLTISSTGYIGLIMNIISTCSFALPAAFIYKKKRTPMGAIIGLVSGIVAMTVMMLLWNYLITPLYMNIPRSAVVPMLTAVFLPFNAIKGAINAAAIMLIYKPLVKALRSAGLIEKREATNQKDNAFIVSIVGAVILITGILIILVLNGVI